MATVYRAIRDLVDQRWLEPVATPAGTGYELAARAHHHHFFCRACLRTFEVEGCVKAVEGLVPPGFVADRHDLTFSGRCTDCASRPGPKRSGSAALARPRHQARPVAGDPPAAPGGPTSRAQAVRDTMTRRPERHVSRRRRETHDER